MSAAFETMDKEVHFIQYRYYLTYLTTVDLFVCEPRNSRVLYCRAWGGGGPQRTQNLFLSEGQQVCLLCVGS